MMLPVLPIAPPDPSTAVRGTVVIASSDDRLAISLHSLAHREGFETVVVTDPAAAIESAKVSRPDCVWIDAAMKGLDAGRMVRILQRYSPTRCSVPILIAPEGVPPLRLHQMASLGALCVLRRPVGAFVLAETFRAAVTRSRELKAQYESPALKSVSPTRRVLGNSSLLARRVACPFHDKPVPFDRFILRTGRILTDISLVDLPVYKSAVAGKDFVNFHLLSIAVCPQCLFATNNPAYLIDPGVSPHEHTPATRKAIIEDTPARIAMAANVGPDFLNEHRTDTDAVTAHELAIRCGETIFATNRSSLPLELLRLGNYHLRLAHLHELRDPADASRESNTAKALVWLKQAFAVLDAPALYKATYQTIAAAISLGEDREAYPYLARLKELRGEPVKSKTDLAILDRYIARAASVWENRDYHRLPGVPARLQSEQAA